MAGEISNAEFAHYPEWERIGKTFETMRLIPSIRMYDHFHGNVEGGELTVDQTGFQCRTTAWEKNQEETEKPMTTDETKAAPQVHHEDAGDVGETGEHGDLGQNAAGAARALPSADDLDKDAAEKAAAAATAGRVVKVPEATDAKPAPNAEEIKVQIAGSLVLAGYSPEEAAKLAATAWANKNG